MIVKASLWFFFLVFCWRKFSTNLDCDKPALTPPPHKFIHTRSLKVRGVKFSHLLFSFFLSCASFVVVILSQLPLDSLIDLDWGEANIYIYFWEKDRNMLAPNVILLPHTLHWHCVSCNVHKNGSSICLLIEWRLTPVANAIELQ